MAMIADTRKWTFFGSNFFGFENTNNGHSLIVASNIWIYVVAAAGFFVVVIATWYLWRLRKRSMSRAKTGDVESSS
jgi:hypothetical protein